MTTHHLPISIPEILHGKSVEWERLEFKQGWNQESELLTQKLFSRLIRNTSLQSVSTTGRGTVSSGAVPALYFKVNQELTKHDFSENLIPTKPARPLAEAQIGGSLVYGGRA